MKKLKKQFEDIQRDLATAVALCDTLQDKVHDLESMIELEEKSNKKPMMYSTNGVGYEISSYHKHSDHEITFTLAGNFNNVYQFRVINLSENEYVYPNKKTITCKSYVHEFNEFIGGELVSRGDWIDHIELLEGVDHYDKT